MSCSNCSSGIGGSPRGCKNNGTCGSDSCNKLTVFDWLENMEAPQGEKTLSIVEVRFKNSRKEFFRYPNSMKPHSGQVVITETSHGYDVGTVTLAGSLVGVQMKRKKVAEESEAVGHILRLANTEDIALWQQLREKEAEVQKRARELAIALQLEMKISDVEFQGDGKKATFYYTAADRVDFRQLIKDLAQAFSIRIEMKQIGLRQEASRLGGIGTCGRELCCSTWLTDFRSVSSGAARYQQLSLNPQKLSGQCGRLKCCLNYELDAYRKAIKAFPRPEVKLHTEKGIAVFQKMDIFKQLLWYSYKDDWITWHKIPLEAVLTIIKKNKEKLPVASLEEYIEELPQTDTKLFESAVGQDSLNRFDTPKKKHFKRGKNRNNRKKRYEKPSN